MPTLETPPNAAPSTSPPPTPDATQGNGSTGDVPTGSVPVSKILTRQFGELDHTELVRLLDTLDDERSKARFRESIYISLFFWIGVVAFLIFAPKFFPHSPQFVTPSTETMDHHVASLTLPPDVQRAMDHAPRSRSTPKTQSAASTPQLRQPAQPAAPAPKASTQPRQQPAPPTTAPPPPPPVVQQSPLPTPRNSSQPNVAALPSAPSPSPAPTKPNFANPTTSARDMVRQAGQAPRGGGSGSIGFTDAPSQRAGRGIGAGAQILSDTQNVDFDPYLKKILEEIRSAWEPLIPEEARPPLNKQGEAQIRFTILPDGRIGGMTLESSTEDDAINRSCWGSITSVSQFPPLPSQFHGPNLELRIHYLVNREPR